MAPSGNVRAIPPVAWVRPPEPIRGLDHLGVQAPCIALYGQLLPGITNVTDRARYYSFHPWLLWSFEKRFENHSLIVRALRVVEQRPEWRKTRLELVDRDDEWALFEAAVETVAWGDASLAARALAEGGGEWFDELSMVMGLLAWLAWDVQVDAEAAANDLDWFPVQLLAALGLWLVGDDSAADVMADGVARTPRFGVDGSRWVRVHRSLLDAFAEVASAPDKHGVRGRRPEAGDLVVLPVGQTPRVRVILEVHQTPRGTKVEVWDPSSDKGTKQFMGPLIASLAWVTNHPSARNHA
ncbi:MAG: hypothetical protein IPJ65_13680 [Archangiaceae bacterium]|nr:hypothetical protein [Archangiaceae bacterium]